MSSVRSMPCEVCPYRQDVPSGVWSAAEYDKLPAYDGPLIEQPQGTFQCHATPDHYCHGWAVCHSQQGPILALRIYDPEAEMEIPPAGVPLFASGAEAAEHGKADIENPGPEARRAVERLMGKYERLQYEDGSRGEEESDAPHV